MSAAAAPPPPYLHARAAAVLEASTGTPVFGLNGGERMLVASTTKMVTALVAVNAVPLTKVCTAPPYAATPDESLLGLQTGERMSVADLLRGMLVVSGNDAAADLATCVAGSTQAFVARMNATVRRLGLEHTHFANPVGLDAPGNYSSAADLDRIAIAVRASPFLRETVDLRHVTLHGGAYARALTNRNTLLLDTPWVNGVKTGHTNAAGWILVASGTQHGLTFVASVIGDPDEATRDGDARALLDWAFASWHFARPVVRGRRYAQARVAGNSRQRVDLVAKTTVRRLLRRDASVRVRVEAPRALAGPLSRHTPAGRLVVTAAGRTIARVPLLTATAVPERAPANSTAPAVARTGTLSPSR